MYRPGASQVRTTAVDGKSNPRLLGELGHVTALRYSFTLPGGPDQMSCTLQREARYRTSALTPGRWVEVLRGGSVVWSGKLDEPDCSSGLWSITAQGAGVFGTSLGAVFHTWLNNPDESINNAIARGLNWTNPGIGSPAGMWLGQRQNPGSLTITDLLNLVCTRGGLTWYVGRQNRLSVFPLPSKVNRVLVATSPVSRSLGGDINTIWIRHRDIVPDPSDTVIKKVKKGYVTISVTNDASIAKHGPLETFLDLSSAGLMTDAEASAVGQHVLDRYQRASFAGPFTVQPGQYLNRGGVPVDLGCEQAGTVARLVAADSGYGAEIGPKPITFAVGGYEFDDDTGSATVTPFLSLRHSFSDLLGLATLGGQPHRHHARHHRHPVIFNG